MTAFRQPYCDQLAELFGAPLQALAPHRYYRIAAQRLVSYLQTDFPNLHRLSDLRRDPHLLGWFRSLDTENPPLSNSTRRVYLIGLRCLLRDLAPQGPAVPSALILPGDFPLRPPRPRKPPRPPQNRCLPLPHPAFRVIFETCIQTLAATRERTTIHGYRLVARDFLSYLEIHFPQLRQLSELRPDPHWLGWLRSLSEQQPPRCAITQQKYRLKLRTMFQQLAASGHLLQDELLRIEDLPWPRRRAREPLAHPTLGTIFETQIQTLAATLRPSTVHTYRHIARRFLSFLQSEFPQLQQLSELRRDPHWLAWLRFLHQQQPLSNTTRQGYLWNIRRLLHDLESQGHSLSPGLVFAEDFPPRPRYLPRALSPEDDQRLQQQLRRQDDLLSNALLLTRATGIRIGECVDLAVDCLRTVGQQQWALHVPLGKLHTERLVPVDEDVRNIVSRIMALRSQSIHSTSVHAGSFLLPRPHSHARMYHSLRYALSQAADHAKCSHHVTCHQLRHTYASEMVRLGVNLPALMQLLGHKDIRMTLRYVQVTQQDLQREYHAARRSAVNAQLTPALPFPIVRSCSPPEIAGILQAIAATNHLVEMHRRRSRDEQLNKKLSRLGQRLRSVATELRRLATGPK